MKIAYPTGYNPLDVHSWSGLGLFISKALENAGAEIQYISSLKKLKTPEIWANKMLALLSGKKFYLDRDPVVLAHIARQILSRLERDTDWIFSPGSPYISRVEAPVRKAFYTGSCFAGMVDYYPEFSDLSQKTLRDGHLAEALAIQRADHIFYASDWAKSTAVKFYQADPGKITVVPYGANIEKPPAPSEIAGIISNRKSDVCRILFLGVDWERKGGSTVLETVKRLRKQGVEAELHLAGLHKNPVKTRDSWIFFHGFISKSDQAGRDYFRKLFLQSSFLMVPSKAEAFGVVFSEASAFALPSVSYLTGGIPSVISDGVTGILLDPEMDPARFSDEIGSVFSSPDRYTRMSEQAYERFRQKLNWTTAGQTILRVLQKL
ncbi:MAG: glycosyltransferase family 4 protein [Bacteroidetes bacterium]|nr:glycosyltransferase family 4 protein [Bacteroidota bacterium]